jgi:hypothetical protein
MTLFEYYVLGALITSSLIVTWFNTNLPLHVWSLLGLMQDMEDDLDIAGYPVDAGPPETWEDWETLTFTQNKFFSELLTCPLCLGTWVSTIVAISLIVINELTWWFLPATMFSWPLLAFLLYKASQKKEIDT